MKTKGLLGGLAALCLVAFAACSDDNNGTDWNEGAKVQLPQERAFVLNMGVSGSNNASLTFYDPLGRTATIGDIYYTQNGKYLGDTGQDIIEYDGNLYVVMSGSNYIAKLSGAGVEQCRYQFTEEQGQPRFMAAEDGKIYVTLYSGNVARLDAATLAFEAMVKVGNNPEQIIEHDGKLYCVNSGWGADNRLSIIDIAAFSQAEHVEIFQNPEKIVECGDRIFLQGYGSSDWTNYPYPVAVYDQQNKTYEQIGQGTHIAALGNTLYVIFSEMNWTTYEATNTFYTYDAAQGKPNNTPFLKDIPDELATASINMFSVDDDRNELYIGVSHASQGNSDIYRFKADGTYVGKFESGGTFAYKMIFVD